MAAYRLVYDSRHLQADCQEPGSAPEPYVRQSSMGYLYLYLYLGRSLLSTIALLFVVQSTRVSAAAVARGRSPSRRGRRSRRSRLHASRPSPASINNRETSSPSTSVHD